jgi:hypothetical protein
MIRDESVDTILVPDIDIIEFIPLPRMSGTASRPPRCVTKARPEGA